MPPKKGAAKPKTTKSRAKPKKSTPQPIPSSSRQTPNEPLLNNNPPQTTNEPSSLATPNPQPQPSSNLPVVNTQPQPLAQPQPQQATPQPQTLTPSQTKELAFRAAVTRARGDGTTESWDPTQLTESQHAEHAWRIMCAHKGQPPSVAYGYANVFEALDDAVRERGKRRDDGGGRGLGG